MIVENKEGKITDIRSGFLPDGYQYICKMLSFMLNDILLSRKR